MVSTLLERSFRSSDGRTNHMASFKLKAVDQQTLSALIKQPQTRAGSSKGAELIEEFKSGSDVAAQVSFASTKERNSVSISATTWARSNGIQIWVRKLGGGQGTDLLLIDLDRADADTKKAYETRPRPGRRPKAR
ncbi:MAG: hypothetical protein ABIV94_00310 [Acidimicrobiales bacterium]